MAPQFYREMWVSSILEGIQRLGALPMNADLEDAYRAIDAQIWDLIPDNDNA